ncbi:MAG: hypothetical protein LBD15_01740 [Holosporales bacterium]|jgi:hypothetical protein|nr:hypothetical protein [Holosporales bacterium]
MEVSLLLSDRAIIIADPENRSFQTVSYADASRICQQYTFLRLFSDQKTISFFLKELPAVPPWIYKKMIRLNLNPKIPSYWFAVPLSYPFLFRKKVSLVPFQVAEQPLCFPQEIPEIPGAYLAGIEPILLGIPKFVAYLTDSSFSWQEWWVYCADHQLSGMRLVFGRGKGIVLSRTLNTIDSGSLPKELEHTLKYIGRLGWQGETITGLLVSGTKEFSSLQELIKNHTSFQVRVISLVDVARKTEASWHKDISIEEILFYWILRTKRHFPCLGQTFMRWHAIGLRTLNALRPLCYSLGCTCCVVAFCSFLRISTFMQQEQAAQGLVHSSTVRIKQLEALTIKRLHRFGVTSDIPVVLENIADLQHCAQYLQQVRAHAVLPKLKALSALFKNYTPNTLTLQMAPEETTSFEIDLLPEEKEAFLSFISRVSPKADVTLPQEVAFKPLLSHTVPTRTCLKITLRSFVVTPTGSL